jgi:aspartate ammonia-lyase
MVRGMVRDMVRGMVMVKKAAAMANREMGTIRSSMADAMNAACDQVLLGGRCLDQFPVDVFQGGAGTSVNMNTNEVIASLALEHLGLAKGRYDEIDPNDHVNRCQSTNDAYATALCIALFTVVQALKVEVELLATALDNKAAALVTCSRWDARSCRTRSR